MFTLAEYRIRTSNADWQGICSLNGVDYDSFWTKNEFVVLEKIVKKGEVVLGFSAGTVQLSADGKIKSRGKDSWLVVLSSERVILINASNPKSSPIVKTFAVAKISGMVASQNKALGQLVIVLDNGIVTIENAMVNTTRSMENVFRQLRECEKDRAKNTASKTVSRKVESRESKLQENKVVSRNENKSEKVTDPNGPKQITNPFAEENEEVENDGKVSVANASVVALLIGRTGIHDFIWGKTVFGIVKLILVFTLIIAMRKDLYVFSSLVVLILGIWVTIDIFNMFSKKFFGDRPCKEIQSVFRGVIIACCVVDILICCVNLFLDIRDLKLKDYGGHVYWNEIVDAYRNNTIAERKRFEKRRFSIIAQVGSVKKNMFGEYDVKLDGLSLLPDGYQNEIKSMVLTFSHQQAGSIEKMQKGDMFAASCIGRGVSLGSWTADKCILKHVRQYR